MDREAAARQVFEHLKNEKEGNHCAYCIAEKIQVDRRIVQSSLDALVGIGKVERHGGPHDLIYRNCWTCMRSNRPTYSYQWRLRDVINPMFHLRVKQT